MHDVSGELQQGLGVGTDPAGVGPQWMDAWMNERHGHVLNINATVNVNVGICMKHLMLLKFEIGLVP